MPRPADPNDPPTAVLAAGGPLTPREAERLREATRAARWRIGVDGGARHLRSVEVVPDYVTGDFDTLTPEELATFAESGAEIVPTPDQDFTDLDKAVAFAMETLGATRLRVYAATGGRLDHIYSVLSVVVKYGRRVDLRLADEWGETWLVDGAVTLTGADLPGRVLSLMAMGTTRGVTTTGVEWPLTGEDLAPGVRDGTLNRVTAQTVTVRVETGDLLLLLHWPDAA
jgi:thiamine pyrophosphokinase